MNDKVEKIIEYILIVCAVIALSVVQCSCRAQFPIIESVRTDSVYVTCYRIDSVYIHDSIKVTDKGDTIFQDRWHVEYRYKAIHDTIFVDKFKTQTVEVNRLTKSQRNMIAGFWTLLVLLLLSLALLVWKNWGNIRFGWLKLMSKILIK